jgi:hypothetical protein
MVGRFRGFLASWARNQTQIYRLVMQTLNLRAAWPGGIFVSPF